MSYDAVKAYFSIHLRGISKAKRSYVPAVQSHNSSKLINAASVHVSTTHVMDRNKSNTLAGCVKVFMLQ